MNARADSGTSDVICQAVTKLLDDGTVVGGQVKFFKNFDTSQPVDCAFELLIQQQDVARPWLSPLSACIERPSSHHIHRKRIEQSAPGSLTRTHPKAKGRYRNRQDVRAAAQGLLGLRSLPLLLHHPNSSLASPSPAPRPSWSARRACRVGWSSRSR